MPPPRDRYRPPRRVGRLVWWMVSDGRHRLIPGYQRQIPSAPCPRTRHRRHLRGGAWKRCAPYQRPRSQATAAARAIRPCVAHPSLSRGLRRGPSRCLARRSSNRSTPRARSTRSPALIAPVACRLFSPARALVTFRRCSSPRLRTRSLATLLWLPPPSPTPPLHLPPYPPLPPHPQ